MWRLLRQRVKSSLIYITDVITNFLAPNWARDPIFEWVSSSIFLWTEGQTNVTPLPDCDDITRLWRHYLTVTTLPDCDDSIPFDDFYSQEIRQRRGPPSCRRTCPSASLGRNRAAAIPPPSQQSTSLSSFFPPVFRILDILVWIRIRICGSMPLTNGSGSCYFRHWPSRRHQKTSFKKVFPLIIIFWRYIDIIVQR